MEPWSWVPEIPLHSGNTLLSRACSTGCPGCLCTALEPQTAFLPPYPPSPVRHGLLPPPTTPLSQEPILLKVGTLSTHHNRTYGPGIQGPWGEGGQHQVLLESWILELEWPSLSHSQRDGNYLTCWLFSHPVLYNGALKLSTFICLDHSFQPFCWTSPLSLFFPCITLFPHWDLCQLHQHESSFSPQWSVSFSLWFLNVFVVSKFLATVQPSLYFLELLNFEFSR